MTKIVDLLSDIKIKALKPRQKAYRVADGCAMYLLVTPTGGKLWRLKFIDGRPRLVKRPLNDGEKVKLAAIDPDFV